MEPLIASVLLCIHLSRIEAFNGAVLQSAMIANCEVVTSRKWRSTKHQHHLQATLRCKCVPQPETERPKDGERK